MKRKRSKVKPQVLLDVSELVNAGKSKAKEKSKKYSVQGESSRKRNKVKPEVYLSVSDIENSTPFKRKAIYKFIESGQLKASQPGNKIIIKQSDWERFLEKNRVIAVENKNKHAKMNLEREKGIQ